MAAGIKLNKAQQVSLQGWTGVAGEQIKSGQGGCHRPYRHLEHKVRKYREHDKWTVRTPRDLCRGKSLTRLHGRENKPCNRRGTD